MITITASEFRQLAVFIQQNFGVYLKDEKRTLITGRLQTILSQHNFNSFSEYFQYVADDRSGEAMRALLDRVTTHHTFFMREADHFQYFRNVVLPHYQHALHDRDLRIWSAGCSTGEEPYTLAMLMADFFGEQKSLWDTRILATDLSIHVLETAQKGIYKNDSLRDLPTTWMLNYFQKLNNDQSSVVDRIKNEVIFRQFNLMEEIYPFRKKFHVIFCRNVMIYFDDETKYDLVRRFYEFTEPGGFLFIGHSESLDRMRTEYRYVLPAVYRKD